MNHVNQILPNTVKLSPEPKFLWVTEFPLFTHADEDKEFLAHGRWSSSHHPFTAPMREDIEKMYLGKVEEVRISRSSMPLCVSQADLRVIRQVRGQHYDLVLNGQEIGGGSVRIHEAAMQDYIFSKVLQVCNHSDELHA